MNCSKYKSTLFFVLLIIMYLLLLFYYLLLSWNVCEIQQKSDRIIITVIIKFYRTVYSVFQIKTELSFHDDFLEFKNSNWSYYKILSTKHYNIKMFEARLLQGAVLKKIVEAIRELVVDANLDCSPNGISMQVFFTILTACSMYS